MDNSSEWFYEKRYERVMKSLEKNNMSSYLVKDKNELLSLIDNIMIKNSKVGVGDSMTLFETGIIDYIRKNHYFLDKYKEGMSREEKDKLYLDNFSTDYFLASCNAITENGELYNVDGYANRVAPIIFGPKNVILVVGKNKIVKDMDEAILRVKNIAAPIDAKRLNKKTPCVKTGVCYDCKSPERICNVETIIKRQHIKDRIIVIIIKEDYGY